MTLKNVQWVNKTLNVSAGDQSVRQNLTNDFFANVATLGDGLYLGDWSRTGIGDLVLMMDWVQDFYQYKPLLKNTRVNWRIGFNFPTGLREDEDKVFARPFGFDGALGLIFGFGWALTGACPGPMFVTIGYGYLVMIVVVISALLGTFCYGLLRDKLPH